MKAAAMEMGHDISMTDVQEMVHEADLSGEGEITLESLERLMTSN